MSQYKFSGSCLFAMSPFHITSKGIYPDSLSYQVYTEIHDLKSICYIFRLLKSQWYFLNFIYLYISASFRV